MPAKPRSVFPDGLIAGLLGAVVLAIWYVLFDIRAGHPLQTGAALGKFLFRGYFSAEGARFVPAVTVGSMVFYLVFFGLAGVGLTKLAELAARNRSLRMGVWLGLVIAFAVYLSLTVIVARAATQPLPLGLIVLGSLLSVTAMAAFVLWRYRPLLATSEPLGAEGNAPPHPPS